MEWSPTVPILVGGLTAIAAGATTQYLTHLFTRRREAEKVLRDKAEELISTLYHIDHSLFVWHHGIMRDASDPRPQQGEAVGSVSLIAQLDKSRPSTPGDHEALQHSIRLDLQRADTLQRLYFVSVQRYYEAHVDAIVRLVEWLETYMRLQEEDPAYRLEQLRTEHTGQWSQLHDVYGTAHAETIEAIAKTVVPYREPPRALSRLHHRGARGDGNRDI